MKRKHIIFFLFCITLTSASGQTLEQARIMFTKGQYEQAKPVFQKYVKQQPANANYNYWYGVCCLKTGSPQESLKYLETATQKKIQNAPLYLGEAYNEVYRFEDAVSSYEDYIAAQTKKKQPTEDAEKLLEKARANLRMLRGVEEVCVIDSFVVDKANFLGAYKISEEAGKLFTFNDYFQTQGNNPGTVYQTELGNRIYYSETGKDNTLNILSKNKLLDEWGKGTELPGSINSSANANYPYVMSDGVTIYYASDGASSMGGYDIFVTRYNSGTDSYLTPENVGMPFNSPFNDYMYVVDDFNNLGWFASDRFQPEGKVCIYVFIPNASKQTYNYESLDAKQIASLAQLHSLKDTWKDKQAIAEARQRLSAIRYAKPEQVQETDFVFVIDDNHTYYHLSDFASPKAKELFAKYEQLSKDFKQQSGKLSTLRESYASANKAEKIKMTPAILDLEKRIQQMLIEVDAQAISVRNAEKQNIK